jgi:Protein of unknown function (DUF3618)
MADGTIRDIERGLERDRVELAQSLSALRERVRPSALVQEGKAAVMARTEPLLSQLDAVVRARPVVTAVAGVTLAALLVGRRGDAAPDPALAGTRFEALTRWEDEGGPSAPEPVDPDEEWLTEATGLRARAKDLLARIDDAARQGLAPVAALARHRAEVIAALASETRRSLGRGLETLDASAREKTLLARERIYLARIALEEKGRKQIEAQPLMAGAVAALAGAGLACLFPQTDTEDRLMGDTRDWLARDVGREAWRQVAQASDLARVLTDAVHSDAGRIASIFSGQKTAS